MDFGVARLAGHGQTTTAGVVVGTPNYMSPEQVKGGEIDGRSDLFSVGLILYELVTGEKAFKAETVVAVVFKILHEEPNLALIPDGPGWERLRSVMTRALARDADERYPSARAMSDDLAEVLRDLGGSVDLTSSADQVFLVRPRAEPPPRGRAPASRPGDGSAGVADGAARRLRRRPGGPRGARRRPHPARGPLSSSRGSWESAPWPCSDSPAGSSWASPPPRRGPGRRSPRRHRHRPSRRSRPHRRPGRPPPPPREATPPPTPEPTPTPAPPPTAGADAPRRPRPGAASPSSSGSCAPTSSWRRGAFASALNEARAAQRDDPRNEEAQVIAEEAEAAIAIEECLKNARAALDAGETDRAIKVIKDGFAINPNEGRLMELWREATR